MNISDDLGKLENQTVSESGDTTLQLMSQIVGLPRIHAGSQQDQANIGLWDDHGIAGFQTINGHLRKMNKNEAAEGLLRFLYTAAFLPRNRWYS